MRTPTSPEPGVGRPAVGDGDGDPGAAGSRYLCDGRNGRLDRLRTADGGGRDRARVVATMPGAAGPASSVDFVGRLRTFGGGRRGTRRCGPPRPRRCRTQRRNQRGHQSQQDQRRPTEPLHRSIISPWRTPAPVPVRRPDRACPRCRRRPWRWSAGERVRRLVAARDRLTGVAPDGDAAAGEPEAARMRAHARQRRHDVAVDVERDVAERGVAALDRSGAVVADAEDVAAQRKRAAATDTFCSSSPMKL